MFDHNAAMRDAAYRYQVASHDASQGASGEAAGDEPMGKALKRRRAHRRPASHAERDALESEKAEQTPPLEIAAQLRQLEAAFGVLTESVLIIDCQGQILRANAADRALLGYGARSKRFTTTLRERAALLMTRDARGEPFAEGASPFARILRGESLGGKRAVNAILRTHAGRDIEVSVTGAPLVNAAGARIGGVIITRDVTEERSRERRLQDATRDMQELLAVAVHDLRTPITASKGYVQLAINRLNDLAATLAEKPEVVGGVARLRKNLQDAEESAQRLARLVERLLDVARLQANKVQVKRELVDLATIIRAIVQDQRLATPTRAIRFVAQPLQAVPILADPDRIAEVLLNYLANALKFSPEESAVEVALDVRDQDARVSVRDRGVGIPPVERERIWRRFEQLGARQGAGFAGEPGLGLGLYISRAIIEAHGGCVGVESAIGGGSIFWFETPLAR